MPSESQHFLNLPYLARYPLSTTRNVGESGFDFLSLSANWQSARHYYPVHKTHLFNALSLPGLTGSGGATDP